MSSIQILLFTLTSLAIILIPGQDLVLVMSRGLAGGARAGIATAAGVSTGLLGHTLLAAAGLGALLLTFDWAFVVLKILGAAYLAWLGLRLLRSARTSFALEAGNGQSLRRLFVEGALSNLSNPKITIFYFAYLPQFIDGNTAAPGAWLLVLGTVFALLTFVVKGPIGFAAGTLSGWIVSHPRVLTTINRVSGVTLLGLGAKLALEQR